MKELSLVFFTLLIQASVGTTWGVFLILITNPGVEQNSTFITFGWAVGIFLALAGMTISFLHLKVPLHAWRAVSNLKSSWLSYEILFASLFIGFMFAFGGLQLFSVSGILLTIIHLAGLLSGAFLIFCMGSTYQLKTVNYWDSKDTILSFYVTTMILGILLSRSLEILFFESKSNFSGISFLQAFGLAFLLLMNAYYSYKAYKRMPDNLIDQNHKIKTILRIRMGLGITGSFMALILLVTPSISAFYIFIFLIVTSILAEFYGRALFYSAQVPYGVYLFKG